MNPKRIVSVAGRHARRVLLVGVALAVTATEAWAQAEATPGDEPSALKQWIAVLVFTGLVLAIAFKNPKRTHQG